MIANNAVPRDMYRWIMSDDLIDYDYPREVSWGGIHDSHLIGPPHLVKGQTIAVSWPVGFHGNRMGMSYIITGFSEDGKTHLVTPPSDWIAHNVYTFPDDFKKASILTPYSGPG